MDSFDRAKIRLKDTRNGIWNFKNFVLDRSALRETKFSENSSREKGKWIFYYGEITWTTIWDLTTARYFSFLVGWLVG
jgi:hypothetical protein